MSVCLYVCMYVYIHIYMYVYNIYIYVCVYIYIFIYLFMHLFLHLFVCLYTFIITTLFVGCKQGGRSKNVSNTFDPLIFFPDWENYMYIRPLLRQKRALEDLDLGWG